MKYAFIACLLVIMAGAGGCASIPERVDVDAPSPTELGIPIGTSGLSEEEKREILERVLYRNKEIEDKPRWIKRAYSGLMLRRLSNVSEREYEQYRKYLDNDSVYVIVHPAFYPFFHGFRKLSPVDVEEDTYSRFNVIEKFLALTPRSNRSLILQAQERRMRDFIEFHSTREKLMIIVIPRGYNQYKGYTYRKHADEYMRYLNEVTNISRSVLFVESRSPNRGYITEENAIRLMEFLLSIDAKRIYVMGGYIGRCLEDFYKFIIEDYGSDGIYVVPELSDISPQELNEAMAATLLQADGTLNRETLTRYLLEDAYKIQELKPRTKHLD